MRSEKYSPAPAAVPAGAAVLTVPDACAGLRLDLALARLLPDHSRSRLKGWIDTGRVRVDGAPGVAKRKLAGGERIDVEPADEPPLAADAAAANATAVVQEERAAAATGRSDPESLAGYRVERSALAICEIWISSVPP